MEVGYCENSNSRVQRKLDELGLHISPRPRWGRSLAESLPTDPTKITVRELGRIHGATVAWESYAQGCLALVEMELLYLHADRENKINSARFVASSRTPIWQIERKIVGKDPSFKILLSKILEKEAEKLILQRIVDGYRKRAEFLSRELSRRQHEFDLSGRVT